MIKLILLTVVIVGGATLLVTHQWSDCLEENSIFTCARMLNR